jgi:hypothetical protein
MISIKALQQTAAAISVSQSSLSLSSAAVAELHRLATETQLRDVDDESTKLGRASAHPNEP